MSLSSPWACSGSFFQGQQRFRSHPRQDPRRGGRAGAASAPSNGGGGGMPSPAPPSWMANPVIAQRELMRQFFAATTAEEQLRLVGQAGAGLDLNTSLQLLSHLADLSLKNVLPGTAQQQDQMLAAIHRCLAPCLPSAAPMQLATTLWSYAAVGVQAAWLDELLQQAAERELAGGPSRLVAYNTRELSSLLFAFGRLARRPTPEVRAYAAAMAAELARRWQQVAYVRGSFSSTDFADLAEAAARLFGSGAAEASSGAIDGGSREGTEGRCSNAGAGPSSATESSGAAAAAAAAATEPLPEPVGLLLDLLAAEVRTQLANKHSARSPWTPRDLVRLARAYAALGHRSARAAQMLDALSSLCVQRVRSRHLNAVTRPGDLAALLEAYADLRHVSVAVPDLLAATADQVRLAAAAQLEAAAASEAAGTAAAEAAAGGPAAGAAQQAAAAPPGGGVPAQDGFTVANISSLVESHLRLGYRPPALLLQSLGPQIRSQLAACPAEDAARLLQLLAAAKCSPGAAVVGLLLGRVLDAGQGSSNGEGGSAEGGGESAMTRAARRAAHELLGEHGAGLAP